MPYFFSVFFMVNAALSSSPPYVWVAPFFPSFSKFALFRASNYRLRIDIKRKGDLGFIDVFLALIRSGTCNKMISKLYNAIHLLKQDNTEYIKKKKWEKEGKVLNNNDKKTTGYIVGCQ